MKKSERAMPLLLEFVGVAATSMVLYAALLRSGQVFGAIAAGLLFAGVNAAARPNYVAQLNPIVTLGLWMARKLSTLRTLVTIGVQMLGGLVAWRLSELILDRPLSSLAGDKFNWSIFTAELLGAFVFTFLLSLVLFSKKLDDGKLYLVGFAALTVGMLIASMPQGAFGIINPALALGIQSWSWTFVLGPLAGGFIGMNVVPMMQAMDARSAKQAKKSVKKSSKKSPKKRK
ncbi:MAG: aquaporin [Candidatus Saccharibacteria bacterium]|nr:aquaporin [Candidatus Saccharibacteria bacterium]